MRVDSRLAVIEWGLVLVLPGALVDILIEGSKQDTELLEHLHLAKPHARRIQHVALSSVRD